ncbi:MAG: hypothetical protein OEY25_11930 [Candidatus Aminicenantes bacterium]|nr:hypothetical protein [Candidatus Aminicenantes bacterium]MDH5707218.1 hypothetical protein [Candidatus Aminicenantes bacterium]
MLLGRVVNDVVVHGGISNSVKLMMKVQSVTVPVPIQPRQDSPTCHNGLWTDRNRRRSTQSGEVVPSGRKERCLRRPTYN